MTEQELYVFMHEHFSYDPDDGIIRVKKRYHNRQAPVGEEAGYPGGRHGRYRIKVNGALLNRTHLVWLMVYGKFHAKGLCLDHIDGDPTNDRLSNLREVTHSQNALNRKIRSDNTLGSTGVLRYVNVNKQGSFVKYVGDLSVNGVRYHTERCDTVEEAIFLRKRLEEKYANGYTRGTSKQRKLT